MIWQFAACLPFFLFCALSVPVFLLFRLPLPLLLLLCMAGIVLIGLQVWLVRESRRSAAELDALLACIEAAGAEGWRRPSPAAGLRFPRCSGAALPHGGGSAYRIGRTGEERADEGGADHKRLPRSQNPLTSIISYTELLQQEEGLPDHVQDYIRVLSDKSKRLQVMVRDVFEVSKAATGNLSVDIKPIDFVKLLRQTLADMGEAIEESGLALRPRLPESPVWIAADGDRLYRVFQNLIGNALKYSLEGSRIYLELTVADGQAAAVLRNTSREELPNGVDLTERFVRGDESRTDGGSGLGLSIARTFTEACGGTFSVQTQADLFTASVSFPLTRERPPKEESAV
ncbi:MAG: sensor histidine kinase [Flavonifractor plautii]